MHLFFFIWRKSNLISFWYQCNWFILWHKKNITSSSWIDTDSNLKISGPISSCKRISFYHQVVKKLSLTWFFPLLPALAILVTFKIFTLSGIDSIYSITLHALLFYNSNIYLLYIITILIINFFYISLSRNGPRKHISSIAGISTIWRKWKSRYQLLENGIICKRRGFADLFCTMWIDLDIFLN